MVNANYKQAFEELAGSRTIGFNTAFAKLFKSITAGLLLSQAAYYERSLRDEQKSYLHDKNGAPNLFWWHSDKQWMDETGLSKAELRTAKKMLRDSNVLIFIKAHYPYESYYRVDFERVAELLNSHIQTCEINTSRGAKFASPYVRNSHLIIEKKNEETKKFLHSSKTDKKDMEFSAKILPTASPEAEETFGKKVVKPKSKPKAETEPSPEEAAVRKSIKNFLAFKCLHATSDAEQAMLIGDQCSELNVVAKRLQKAGATLPDVERFWVWFTNGGDWRGDKVAVAEKKDKKIQTSPSLVYTLWLPFKGSKSVEASTTSTEDDLLSEAYKCNAAKASFEMHTMMEGVNFGDERYETLKGNYLGSNPTAAKLAEVQAYEQA